MRLSFQNGTESFSAKEKIINSCETELTLLRTFVAQQIEEIITDVACYLQ